MFQYDQLEDEIVTRLQTLFDVAVTVPLPESNALITEAVESGISSDKTVILVAYTGSDFDPSGSLNIIKQNENINILLNLQSNKLRGETGIYNVIRLVKETLQGYPISNASRLRLKSIEFDDRDEENSIFSFNIIFTVTKLQAQKDLESEDDYNGALLKKVTHVDKY